jgi:Tfp pilus assembly protein PilN
VRPVNLLPPSERIQRGGARPGSAYAILGVLGVLLVAVVVYVLTANQVTSKQDELAEARQEAQAAQAQAAALGSFGDFASIKATREQSVAALAQARLDWERLMRELSRVIPDDVFVNSLDASAAGTPAAGGAAAAGPTLKLAGCAPSHPDVAALMVRLRRLSRAKDVSLSDSTKVGGDSGGAAGATGGGSGCGRGASFTVSVEFDPAPAAAPESVPAHLGGGA